MQKIKIDFQKAFSKGNKPHSSLFKRWTAEVIHYFNEHADYQALVKDLPLIEFTARFVDEEESERINAQYHHKNKPTNVLAFPFDEPEVLNLTHQHLLGDLILCVSKIEKEAESYGYQGSDELNAYWAHIFIHGLLHLFKFDHDTAENQAVMENIEIAVLNSLGYENPYA